MVRVALDRAIDSGRLKNGQSVPARLTAPVRSSAGVLPAGTPVSLTVVATVPAGRLTAVGEFSLQAVRVGRIGTETDIKTYRGKPGHRDVADAAPAVGTDAGLPAGASLEFHVLHPPHPATGDLRESPHTPGSVNGVASGAPPPTGANSNSGEPQFGGRSSTQGNKVQPPVNTNTFQPTQHAGQASPAPNQPQSPNTVSQGSSTKAR